MSKFVRNLTLFLAGLPLSTTKAAAAGPGMDAPRLDDLSKTVSLRPLNLAMDNVFASHRSHSSHSSHRSHSSHSSHYSGSGGSVYTSPNTPSSPAMAPVEAAAVAPINTPSTALTTPVQPAVATEPALSLEEKRRLQIMRVQIKLMTLGLYNGQMNGVLDDQTKQSLKLFQSVKGLPESGLMTTPTLNALGVPAVN